ncbi:MAG: Eco57I restriction-modification methylase domain-containing protein [Deltaproteobacteria bacterium]
MNKEQIKSAIQQFSHASLTENALNLFKTLGYNTERQATLDSPTYATFKDSFINDHSKFNEEKASVKEWKSVDLLFQLSKEEVLKQTSLFDTRRVDNAVIESYLFFAIELSRPQYSRTELSSITREVNRLFPMPVMVLFKHGETLTLSVINRRFHKGDENRDVLLKVTLIKDIRIDNPHRAHIEILFDLSFDELKRKPGFTNFVELHNAWQKTLDTKELNKRFFQELANWYFWAVQNVEFPEGADKNRDVRNATSVIRLITRLMFVWFLKEKGLVPDELFDGKQLKEILVGASPCGCPPLDGNIEKGDHKGAPLQNSSIYYKAILQNLFFATLNTEMGKRRFRSKNDEGRDGHYFIHNVFRYEKEFNDSKETLEKYFAPIPFLNGGLFECLDKEMEEGGKLKRIRIDGFSDREDNALKVPDELFFCDHEKDIDLNETYGTRNKRYKVRGLIDILSSYKFTIAENTPVEKEVALDPELLGKVFENLLASYNPETSTTARKQTGSFYTPREIVDYMVDESLIAYLSTKLAEKFQGQSPSPQSPPVKGGELLEASTYISPLHQGEGQGEGGSIDPRLRHLFAYNDEPHKFTTAEVDILIEAIDSLKALDPACGSGAFPMGMLHKLVYILRKLDPDNQKWKQKQIDKVSELTDATVREKLLEDIEESFQDNELDYGRKLYLIENCIFGVDIQPIAVQIAKLRFFISLIVDQKIDPKKENLGIRPLPNLETKFVAANTLIGIERPAQMMLRNPEIDRKEAELKKIRERHFTARTPKTKEKYRKEDEKLRGEISELLKRDGFPADVTKKLASWNPYDQNSTAGFFDPEWMFGVIPSPSGIYTRSGRGQGEGGFDIVIGNPPYVRADAGEEHLALRKRIIESKRYETLWEKWDLFIPFIELGYKLLKPNGVTTMIVSDAYCHSKYAQKSQEWFLRNSRILRLDFLSKIKVFDAGVHNIVYFFQKADGTANSPVRLVHEEEFGKVKTLPTDKQQSLSCRAFFPDDNERNSFSVKTVLLDEICYISYGLRPSSDEHEAKGEFTTEDLVSEIKDKIHCKPFVEGKHLDVWLPATNLWIEWGTARAPVKFCRPTFPQMYEVAEKLLAQRSPGPDSKVCYDSQQLIFTPSSVGFIMWHSLTGVRNNSLKKRARYKGEKPPRPDLPMREELEITSRRFAVKYLLAVMNSAFAKNFLRANRRSNIHLYPDDWKQLPIPDVSMDKQTPIVNLVDQILAAKNTPPSAPLLSKEGNKGAVDISALEKQIDEMVYALYGLTEEEIGVVEGKKER